MLVKSYGSSQITVVLQKAHHVSGLGYSESGLIFARRSYWFGVSIALVPALFALPAVWYAGVALVNSFWQLIYACDCPEPLSFKLALFYGIPFGPLLQCVLIGAITDLIWQKGAGGVPAWVETKSRWSKVGLWALAQLTYAASGIWICLAIFAYGLAALMSMLFVV